MPVVDPGDPFSGEACAPSLEGLLNPDNHQIQIRRLTGFGDIGMCFNHGFCIRRPRSPEQKGDRSAFADPIGPADRSPRDTVNQRWIGGNGVRCHQEKNEKR